MTDAPADSVHVHVAVDAPIFTRFPGLTIVAVAARGIDPIAANPAAEARWSTAWEATAASAAALGNAQSHPRVAPWRAAFRQMGLAPRDFRSSIENLMRRALRGGEPFRINPLVDAYNALSLQHAIPIGCFDAERIQQLGGALVVRESRDGDTFHTLRTDAPEAIPPGEVSWACGNVLTTRHFVWRQSEDSAISDASRSVLLVAEVLGEVGHDAAVALRDDLQAMLRDDFGVSASSALIDAEHPAVDLPLG